MAPGQLSPRRLVAEFRFGRATPAAQTFGVVGRPIEHSLSPALHNAAFDATGIDAVYLPFGAESADDFQAFAKAFPVAGVSVTAPFKRDFVSVLANEDAQVRRTGAVNTLKAEGPAWRGRNTDGEGFLAPLDERGVSLRGCRVLVLGTGGAARSVVAALGDRGARVRVVGRSPARAEEVASLGSGVAVAAPTCGDWDLLVNATPVGTWPSVDQSPVAAAVLRGGGIVYDLVYNPPDTQLLREAARAGCVVIGGLDMLVAQAAAQFEWWTGRPAPTDAMRAAAVDSLQNGWTIGPADREGRTGRASR